MQRIAKILLYGLVVVAFLLSLAGLLLDMITPTAFVKTLIACGVWLIIISWASMMDDRHRNRR